VTLKINWRASLNIKWRSPLQRPSRNPRRRPTIGAGLCRSIETAPLIAQNSTPLNIQDDRARVRFEGTTPEARQASS
jgi:hypothetical protein